MWLSSPRDKKGIHDVEKSPVWYRVRSQRYRQMFSSAQPRKIRFLKLSSCNLNTKERYLVLSETKSDKYAQRNRRREQNWVTSFVSGRRCLMNFVIWSLRRSFRSSKMTAAISSLSVWSVFISISLMRFKILGTETSSFQKCQITFAFLFVLCLSFSSSQSTGSCSLALLLLILWGLSRRCPTTLHFIIKLAQVFFVADSDWNRYHMIHITFLP